MNIQSNQSYQDKEEEAMAQRRQSVSLAPAGLDSDSASTIKCVPEGTKELGQCAEFPETLPGVLTDSIQPVLNGTEIWQQPGRALRMVREVRGRRATTCTQALD